MMGDVDSNNIGRRALAVVFRTAALACAQSGHHILMLTSTNGSPNNMVAFNLDTSVPASLSLVTTVPTGRIGSSGPGAGAQHFAGDYAAVANCGSNTTVSAHGQSLVVMYSPSVGARVSFFFIDSGRHHAVRNFTGHWRDGFQWCCLQSIARHRLTIGPGTQESVDAIPGGNARGKRFTGSAI
jgi:hypothetical protein